MEQTNDNFEGVFNNQMPIPKRFAKQKKSNEPRNYHKWTDKEDEVLMRDYPDADKRAELAERFHTTEDSVKVRYHTIARLRAKADQANEAEQKDVSDEADEGNDGCCQGVAAEQSDDDEWHGKVEELARVFSTQTLMHYAIVWKYLRMIEAVSEC